MKRLAIIFLACLALAILAGGCNDNESSPYFARVRVSPSCGVAPLRVEGYAVASGGDETGDPTGGNNNLEVTWNFGDGGTATNTLVYHTFTEAGRFPVTVTATDPDGKTATFPGPGEEFFVEVMPDSLLITPQTELDGGAPIVDDTVTTADVVNFDFMAEACGLNKDNPEDYSKLTFHWATLDGDSVNFRIKDPSHQFINEGEHLVRLRVTHVALGVTRYASFTLNVTAP